MKTIDIAMSVLIALSATLVPIAISMIVGGWGAKLISKSYNFTKIPDLTGKVAIVTGINSGIGKITAIQLALKGATVIGTVRSKEKGDLFGAELNRYMKGAIVPMVMDLASLQSVKKFVDDFIELELPVNILVNNAGVMMTPPMLSEDGVELQFATNHLGPYLLTRLLMDKLVASKARIVHVSSMAHFVPYSGGISVRRLKDLEGYATFQAYGQSKLANLLFSNELASRLNGSGVTSNALHPGSISTVGCNLQRHVSSVHIGEGDSFLKNIGRKAMELGQVVFNQFISLSVEDGALTQLYLATSPEVEGVSGRYYTTVAKLAEPSQHAGNATLAKLLWDVSEELVKDFLPTSAPPYPPVESSDSP